VDWHLLCKQQAKYPARLHIGVVHQAIHGDIDCLDKYCKLMGHSGDETTCPYRQNIRVLRTDASESAGDL
jgi:hypothetical protein